MGPYFRIQYIRIHRFWSWFWGMVYAKHPTLAAKLANRYLSPTWEVTNTFLVFVVVAFLGFFPKAAFTLATVMFVPVMLILVLVAVRSTFMVFAYSLPKYQYLLRVISGITGLLIPALLITVLPVTEGAYITMFEGREVLLYGKLSSPVIYCYMLFGLTSELFLSLSFLLILRESKVQKMHTNFIEGMPSYLALQHLLRDYRSRCNGSRNTLAYARINKAIPMVYSFYCSIRYRILVPLVDKQEV